MRVRTSQYKGREGHGDSEGVNRRGDLENEDAYHRYDVIEACRHQDQNQGFLLSRLSSMLDAFRLWSSVSGTIEVTPPSFANAGSEGMDEIEGMAERLSSVRKRLSGIGERW